MLAILGFGVQSQTDSHHILRGLRHLLTMTKQLSKVSLSQFLVLCRFIQHRWKTILLSRGRKMEKGLDINLNGWKTKRRRRQSSGDWREEERKLAKQMAKRKNWKKKIRQVRQREPERERVTCVWDFFKSCVHSSLGVWWCGTSMIQQSFRFFNFSTIVYK